MSVGAYIGTFILLLIPVVNLILLLVWSFSSGTNRNRKNLARAKLILFLIAIAINIGLFLLLSSLGEIIQDFLVNYFWPAFVDFLESYGYSY